MWKNTLGKEVVGQNWWILHSWMNTVTCPGLFQRSKHPFERNYRICSIPPKTGQSKQFFCGGFSNLPVCFCWRLKHPQTSFKKYSRFLGKKISKQTSPDCRGGGLKAMATRNQSWSNRGSWERWCVLDAWVSTLQKSRCNEIYQVDASSWDFEKKHLKLTPSPILSFTPNAKKIPLFLSSQLLFRRIRQPLVFELIPCNFEVFESLKLFMVNQLNQAMAWQATATHFKWTR